VVPNDLPEAAGRAVTLVANLDVLEDGIESSPWRSPPWAPRGGVLLFVRKGPRCGSP
jgi:hypothetical protein